MVRLRAHRNESLRGLKWQYKTQDKNRLHSRNRSTFFGPEARTISTNRSPHAQFFEHASIYSPSSRSPSWERKPIRFNGDRSPVRFYIYYGALDHSSNLERDHARAMKCWNGDFRFVFVFRFCFLMFVYQAKIMQYCFYHKPLKNSTVLHSPLPRQISTVCAQNRPQVETVSHCTYPSRVKSLQYIR